MDARFLDHPRDRMVDAAIAGLRSSGLAGAGINQVIAASGAPKGSLYHYFPQGKMQLAAEALERYGQERRHALAKAMGGEGPPDEKLKRLFAGMAKGLERERYQLGCAVAGVVLDLQDDCAALAPLCQAQLEAWAEAVAQGLQPLPAARRRQLARLAISASQGALIQARAARNAQALLEAGDMLAQLARQSD